MGVIPRSEKQVQAMRPVSTSSSMDSLSMFSTASDTESIASRTLADRYPTENGNTSDAYLNRLLRMMGSSSSRYAVRLGKRKLQRCSNAKALETLAERDELENEEEIGTSNRGSVFSQILEHEMFDSTWNEFINGAERILTTTNSDHTKSQSSDPTKVIESYKRISASIRNVFKTMRSFDIMEALEVNIVDFFVKTPEAEYVSDDKSNFQRLLMHGIAQYYGLSSKSYSNINGQRIIKINNPKGEWGAIPTMLCSFLIQVKCTSPSTA